MLLTKINKIFYEYQHQFKYWLSDYNLLSSHQDYQKFVIICGVRTGSTMLWSLLSQHDQALTFFELFHRHRESIAFNLPGYRSKSQNQRIIDLRNNDPVNFLKTEVYKPLPKQIKAVGFKLLHTQGRSNQPWWTSSEYDRWWETVGHPPTFGSAESDLWSYLQKNTDIAIIHLKRHNLLQRVLSNLTAQATGNWGVAATGGFGHQKKTVQVELNFDDCLQDFEALRRMEDETDEFFSNHRKFNIMYEDLIDDSAQTINQVQAFLGLKVKPLKTQTKKQAIQSMSEVIHNYKKIKVQFSDTKWETFFE